MMQSVSTFALRSGAAKTDSRVVNLVMPPLLPALPAAPAAAMPSPSLAGLLLSAVGAGIVSSSVQKALESVIFTGCAGAFSESARTSLSFPVTAAAAAITGLMRCVRPPAPWRPSKLRFDVAAQRSCGCSWSGFMARHMEQPGSRQSKPASRKTLSRPSSSAWRFTRPEPGTIIAWTPSATFRPLAMRATFRRSSMRLFVQEPMKTFCTATSSILVPGSRPM
mmetsp:Transcript_59889/g.168801  ORF Transcript_59889/g.168801 Transcript_59889/m.168801 type:complete len:222 (-) Transcript_59889:1100-1765(-)